MNIITRIGLWLDHRFPEKMTIEEVEAYFDEKVKNFNSSLAFLDKRVYDLETSIIKLNSEIETLKTQSTVKMRVSNSTPSTMTPFASKFQSIGGNQSPR